MIKTHSSILSCVSSVYITSPTYNKPANVPQHIKFSCVDVLLVLFYLWYNLAFLFVLVYMVILLIMYNMYMLTNYRKKQFVPRVIILKHDIYMYILGKISQT